MKLSIFACVLSVAVLFGSETNGSKQQIYRNQQDRKQHMSAVTIHALCATGTISQGSGVAVSGDVILTAKHVVSCGSSSPVIMIVSLHDDTSRLVYLDKIAKGTTDLATIKIVGGQDPLPFYSNLNKSDLPYKTRLCSIDGLVGAEKCGRVVDARGNHVIVNVRSIPGNSGSPMFDYKGDVRAIVSMRSVGQDAEFLTFAVPVNESTLKDLNL